MGRCLVIMVTIYGLISDKTASYLKAEKWVFRTIFLIITIKFRKFVWNQGVTNLNYFYYDYYSQKTINSKITSTMSCVEGKDQRNVGNLFWKLQPLLICDLRLANFSLSLMRFSPAVIDQKYSELFTFIIIDPRKMNISKSSLVFMLWWICREKHENGSNRQQNWCENCQEVEG